MKTPSITFGEREEARSNSGIVFDSEQNMATTPQCERNGMECLETNNPSRLGTPSLIGAATLLAFEFPPCYGGVSRLCGALAHGLHARGIKTDLITDARYVHDVSDDINSVEIVGPARIQREWSALALLRRRLGSGLVVCGIWYPEGTLASLAGVRPLVILAHGSEIMTSRALWRRKTWAALMRRVCEAADLVVANSEYTRLLVLRTSPKAKVVAIPLGVDHKRFTSEGRENARKRLGLAGKLVLSSVSRLHGYKGHETVLRALAQLPEMVRRRFVYLIAGKGPYEPALRSEAVRLGLSSTVRWLGFVAEEDIPDVYRASDLFVLCTRETSYQQEVEGFGMVFLEAQACGTPVVGTRTGGIPDAVREGEGGWLIDQDDATALARVLAQLAEDTAPFRAAGIAARKRVERECTWDHYMERFLSALSAQGIQLG
jgi:phosphatidylinositol alpha-1,6-mannosyltransferase